MYTIHFSHCCIRYYWRYRCYSTYVETTVFGNERTIDRVPVRFGAAIKRREKVLRQNWLWEGQKIIQLYLGIDGEIKERQLAEPRWNEAEIAMHLSPRCPSASALSARLFPSFPWPRNVARSRAYISIWRTANRHECRRVFLHLPSNKRGTNRVNYTRHLLAATCLDSRLRAVEYATWHTFGKRFAPCRCWTL